MQTVEQKKVFQKCDKLEEEIEKIHCRESSFGVVVEKKTLMKTNILMKIYQKVT